ncbi:hypothetical protein [Solitalea koreensis]|uniref:Uncharacterized protein n=1 Tax=Solitalea koreensis TaxID=543615 RepID=A0A521BMV4_9SPHI|nr:hypothetical protein [Solitalea koreensis]SMO48446.1 hypothetical protein SAMN06265350_102350 [Solitalea koreensis]
MKAKEIREKYPLNFGPYKMKEKPTEKEVKGMELYRCCLFELYQSIRKGDWTLVGEIVGISADYAQKAFDRGGSAYHNEVVDALEEIIESRKHLLRNRKTK